MADTLLFLDIPGVEGEATLPGFAKLVELESMSWALKTKYAGTDRNKKPEVRPEFLEITKHFDRGSAKLYSMMAKRTKFEKAKLSFTSVVLGAGGNSTVPVLDIVLMNGYVEDIRVQASEAGHSIGVKETLKLSFHKLDMVYHQADGARGKRGTATTFNCVQPSIDA